MGIVPIFLFRSMMGGNSFYPKRRYLPIPGKLHVATISQVCTVYLARPFWRAIVHEVLRAHGRQTPHILIAGRSWNSATCYSSTCPHGTLGVFHFTSLRALRLACINHRPSASSRHWCNFHCRGRLSEHYGQSRVLARLMGDLVSHLISSFSSVASSTTFRSSNTKPRYIPITVTSHCALCGMW
ncbi:hypothetical protein BGY98DRAFT_553663 [Russula aff. rugulosa BPL654]|nr:hypothetical protein BGY98DRAFT_553663 [Russula aff. rugulosa BPL654]